MPKKIVRSEREITGQRTPRHVVPDPDYVADLEMSDGQRAKRMADRAAGKSVKPPQPR